MAMTLKLSKTKTVNPQTKEVGFRTTVKSNGKADMDSLVASASKNTTMHKAELRMAFELMLDAIQETLSAGKSVELKGIGNIGVAFYPSTEVHAAVATAKTSWTKDNEGDEPTTDGGGGSSSTGGTQQPGGGNLDA